MLTAWIKSPIPYAGCKFDMLDELESVIGSGETLVDMFTGSGVVGANMAPRSGKSATRTRRPRKPGTRTHGNSSCGTDSQ